MKPGFLAASLLLTASALCACSGDAEDAPAPAQPDQQLVQQMKLAIAELEKRPEHGEGELTIQHLLVGVAGALPNVKRTESEAEGLAADLYARAKGGEDFDTLVKNFTDDEHPGIYTMSLTVSDQPKVYRRDEMTVAAFGDVAWRLAVGELGVAPYDGDVPGKPKSPYGYHVIKRLK
jgi:hypothetical protein